MIWFYILCALQVADIYTTQRILKNGGREINPVMAKLFDKFGVMPSLIVTKSLLLAAVFYADILAIQVLCAIYSCVIIFNLRSLK